MTKLTLPSSLTEIALAIPPLMRSLPLAGSTIFESAEITPSRDALKMGLRFEYRLRRRAPHRALEASGQP